MPTRRALTHMAMSLASPGLRASSGPTSFTAEKWSWSCGQAWATCGSWYTSWGREEAERLPGVGEAGKGSGRRQGGAPERLRLSHVVVQKEGDPVGGVVQEQQPLQEAGQERGGLLHEHGQQHPRGRLEDATAGLSGEPGLPLPLSPCRPLPSASGYPGAPLPDMLQGALVPHPGTPSHLPPRECPPVPVAEPTASLGRPAIGDIVSQVVQLQL